MFYKIINPTTLAIEHTYWSHLGENAPLPFGGPWGVYPHVMVPTYLDSDCVKAQKEEYQEEVVDVPEQIIPEQGHWEEQDGQQVWVIDFPEQTIPAVTHIEDRVRFFLIEDTEAVEAKRQRLKQEEIRAAYQRMDADIIAESKRIFGSETVEAMFSWQFQWDVMLRRPEEFIGKMGLMSVEQVLAYANNKIDTVSVPVGQYRLDRIAQFLQERDEILTRT